MSRLRLINFRIDETLLDMLDYYAIKHGITRSEAIRRAIEELVKSDNELMPVTHLKSITVKVPEELLQKLDAYAVRHGLNKSVAVRLAVERLVRKELSRETVPPAKIEKIEVV